LKPFCFQAALRSACPSRCRRPSSPVSIKLLPRLRSANRRSPQRRTGPGARGKAHRTLRALHPAQRTSLRMRKTPRLLSAAALPARRKKDVRLFAGSMTGGDYGLTSTYRLFAAVLPLDGGRRLRHASRARSTGGAAGGSCSAAIPMLKRRHPSWLFPDRFTGYLGSYLRPGLFAGHGRSFLNLLVSGGKQRQGRRANVLWQSLARGILLFPGIPGHLKSGCASSVGTMTASALASAMMSITRCRFDRCDLPLRCVAQSQIRKKSSA